MRKVFKYELGNDLQELVSHKIPVGAKFLTLLQKPDEELPVMYFEIEEAARKEHRQFIIAGTGHKLGKGNWLGTFLDRDGFHVWHVYELEKK